MTFIHPPEPRTKLQITLILNPYRDHLRGFWFYTRFLALPVILFHVFLIAFLDLPHGLHAGIVGGFSILLFTGLYFWPKQAAGLQEAKLVITTSFLEISSGRTSVRINKKEIHLDFIGWGSCEETLLPAVRIRHNGTTITTIGARTSSNHWTEIRRSVQATEYILPEQVEWTRFKAAIS